MLKGVVFQSLRPCVSAFSSDITQSRKVERDEKVERDTPAFVHIHEGATARDHRKRQNQ